MEDISDEAFEKILETGIKAQEENVKNNEAAADLNAPVTLKLSKYFLYLELPSDVTLWVGRMIFDEAFQAKNIGNSRYMHPSSLVSQLSAVDELKAHKDLLNSFADVEMKWLIKRISTGWNSGIKLFHRCDLIRFANLRSQVEFVPHTYEVSGGFPVICGVLHKLRLSSVPLLPGRIVTKILNNVYEIGAIRRNDGSVTGKTGVLVRPVPANLLAAFQGKKATYVPFAIGSQMLGLATKVFPDIPNMAVLDLIFKNNVMRFDTQIGSMDVSCWETINPMHNQKSLFSGPVLSQWGSFFQGFAYDAFGPISSDRVLASLPVEGFVGPVNSVALYCIEPRVFKCPNKVQCITDHSYISELDTAAYPPDYCYYVPSPADLNIALAAKKFPKVLALPLTGVLSGCPQVEIFAKYHGRISVTVYFCEPALVCFSQANVKSQTNCGIPGGNILDQIGSIERGFVKGFLKELVERAKGQFNQGFRIDHYNNSYNITYFNANYPNFCGRYMGLTSKEKERYTPSVRFTDVSIDGVRAHEAPIAIMQGYPRIGVNYNMGEYEELEYGSIVDRKTGKKITNETIDPKLHMWDTAEPRTVPAMGIHDKLRMAKEKREARAKQKTEAEAKAKENAAAKASSPKPASPGAIPDFGPIYVPTEKKKEEAEEGEYVPPEMTMVD